MGKRTHHQGTGVTVKRGRFLTKKGPSGEAGKDYTALKGKGGCLFVFPPQAADEMAKFAPATPPRLWDQDDQGRG